MKEREILFLDHAPAVGGAEHVLLSLLAHPDFALWRCHLACPDGLLAEQAAALGVVVHRVPLPRLRRSWRASTDWWAGVLAVVQVAQRIGASLLVANTVRAAMYTAPAARWVGRPFVWYMHDFWLSESRPHCLLGDEIGKRLLCVAAKRVIANSRATAEHIACPRKTTVVLNGIDTDRFDPAQDGTPFRRHYGIAREAPLVGVVGRLRPWKGQDRFLRVLAYVCETIPQAQGLVVGGAIFEAHDGFVEQLEQLASTLGIRDRVVFTGQLGDPRPALAAMDVFVHPGDPEPFGLVNVEAMAMAKPVVAFAHGALPEIVIDGQTGILVPPGDEVAMAKAIVDLLGDSRKRELMGSAARDRAVGWFSMERVVSQVAEMLHRVVQS